MICEDSRLDGDVDGPTLVCPTCGKTWFRLGSDRTLPEHTRCDAAAM